MIRIPRFRDPKVKKKNLWEEIAQAMQQKGYLVDADGVDRKMRNMKNTYRTICDNNNKKKSTGKGRMNWEYYNYFVDMFQDDKTVNLPKTILSSTKINQNLSPQLSLDVSGSEDCSSTIVTCTTPLQSPSSDITQHEIRTLNVDTPTSKEKAVKAKRLDKYRKRQLKIEEEKLKELKRMRESIEESNQLQKERIELLKEVLLNSNKQ